MSKWWIDARWTWLRGGVVGLACAAAVPGLAAPQAPDTPKPEDPVRINEQVVVSSSKVETTVGNSPSTISVISSETIAANPAQNAGDLVRQVPGVNVIQTSARDVNITTRQATSVLANSQLVLLDGRPLYLDFLGVVLWDFLPQSSSEIQQIEVVRGPASTPWGANALTGVINVITKTPRDAQGFNLNLIAGMVNRDGGSREAEGAGKQYGANFSYAAAPSERWSWRLSSGYYQSDPFSRPVGTVPASTHPLDPTVKNGGGIFPRDCTPGADAGCPAGSTPNAGTTQPKVDLRVDHEWSDGGRLTLQGGYAGTDGIIHSGLGPFDIQSPSWMAYPKVQYTKGTLRLAAFANFVDGIAPNLIALDPLTGTPVVLDFKSQTYDFELGNGHVLGGKHFLSYGGNIRRNAFDISIAPQAEDRTEIGAYVQEEFFLNRFRLVVGGRVDKFGNLKDPVFSPRISVMVKPGENHSLRASFNRAFRSPSVINNYLDLGIGQPVTSLTPLTRLFPPPPGAAPFLLGIRGVGNPDLQEERLDAYELAYTGSFGGTTLGLAVYQNDQDQNINLTTLTEIPTDVALENGLTYYSVQNPARGLTLAGQPFTFSPVFMATLGALGQRLPETASRYLNLGPIRQRGIEVSLDHRFSAAVAGFANYSYQRTPEVRTPKSGQLPYFASEVGIPARDRFNAGVNINTRRFLAHASVNYTGEAYWVEVLAPLFAGATDSFAQVNASFGVKWMEGRLTTTVKAVNLLNEEIRQHVYGDLTRLNLVFEARLFVK